MVCILVWLCSAAYVALFLISEHVTSNASDSESSYRKFSFSSSPPSMSPADLASHVRLHLISAISDDFLLTYTLYVYTPVYILYMHVKANFAVFNIVSIITLVPGPENKNLLLVRFQCSDSE